MGNNKEKSKLSAIYYRIDSYHILTNKAILGNT